MAQTITLDEVRDRREFGQFELADECVRQYRANGTLYVYREDGDHIVVSKGRDAGDQWAKRTPAERQAALVGQRLWSIPDNWTPVVRHARAENQYDMTYRIGGGSWAVRVSHPVNCYLTDAWYRVEAVGDLRYEADPTTDAAAAREVRDQYRERRDDATPGSDEWELTTEVIDVLDDLLARWRPFVVAYRAALSDDVAEVVTEPDHPEEYLRADGDTLEPWPDSYPLDYVIDDVTHETHTATAVDDAVDALRDAGALDWYPPVRVVVDEDSRPEWMDLTACMEADCSPAEAVDYLATQRWGYQQAEWAEVRGVDPSTVSGNVRQGRANLQ